MKRTIPYPQIAYEILVKERRPQNFSNDGGRLIPMFQFITSLVLFAHLLLQHTIAPASGFSWPSPGQRGITEVTGVLHVHSPYSHDACDNNPMPGGLPDAQCLADLRQALCDGRRDFYMLADHRESMQDQGFEQLFWYDPSKGDALVYDSDGTIIANRIACAKGRPAYLFVGAEIHHNMPIGLQRHLARRDDYAIGFDLDEALDSQLAEVQAIHDSRGLAILANTDQPNVSVDRILSLKLDGMEIYNAAATAEAILRDHPQQLLQLESWLTRGPNTPQSDYVALLMFPSMSALPITRWDQVTPQWPLTGVFGTDVHENLHVPPYCTEAKYQSLCDQWQSIFPNIVRFLKVGGPVPMADGKRLDDYARMFRWFSNHVRLQHREPKQIKDGIARGSVYMSFDILGLPAGFDFFATPNANLGSSFTEMGEVVSYAPGLTLHIKLPRVAAVDVRGRAWSPAQRNKARIRALLKRVDATGSSVAADIDASSPKFSFPVAGPGVYRLEVYIRPRHLTSVLKGQKDLSRNEYLWILSNPIYVR